MHYKLSESDKRRIENSINSLLSYKVLRTFQETQVEVGDVLIMEELDWQSDKWQPKYVSEGMRVPKKYRVVHVDECGVAWVKLIKVTGGMGKSIKSTLNINFAVERWRVDPKMLDSILLQEEYDPRLEYRNWSGKDAR
jgi:hypothetical protein